MKVNHDKTHMLERSFNAGDHLLSRNYGCGEKCLQAAVTELTGPVSYKVQVDDIEQRLYVDPMCGRIPAEIRTDSAVFVTPPR